MVYSILVSNGQILLAWIIYNQWFSTSQTLRRRIAPPSSLGPAAARVWPPEKISKACGDMRISEDLCYIYIYVCYYTTLEKPNINKYNYTYIYIRIYMILYGYYIYKSHIYIYAIILYIILSYLILCCIILYYYI